MTLNGGKNRRRARWVGSGQRVWRWLTHPEHRRLLTLWAEGYTRSLVHPAGPWTDFAQRTVHDWLDMWGYTAKIIVGSIRGVIDVQSAALAGAHIITIPPQFLPKMVDHRYTRETVRQFNEDATKVVAEISRAKAAAAD